MVQYIYKYNVAVWTKKVNNPKKHKKYQVMVHNQGSYPYVFASFDKKKDAEIIVKTLIRAIKEGESKGEKVRL